MSLYIIIDDKKFNAESGETILAVAKRNGIDIPTLCNQPELKPFASCFICVVELEGAPRLVPACSTVVADGMKIKTDSERVRISRRMCVELLLSDHVGDCRGPCQVECPAGIDIPGFISLLAHKNTKDAIKLIKETLPFPASLGRVCPRPCEQQCRRLCSDDAVSICFLKRFIADEDLKQPEPYVPPAGKSTGKKVAIIGAGPSGLSAAFYLRMMGHDVTVFDSHAEAGGMLRYGIPAYRLPREILAQEIGVIEKMGVRIECKKSLGRDFTIDSLAKQYDAIFLAIGAQSASEMKVEGEREGGAIPGIEFLEEIAKGKKVEIGNDVVVVGGGNTAIDAARTSLRLGAKNVTILYRRTRDEMPANAMEIEAALHEGVKMHFLAAPIRMAKLSSNKIPSPLMGEGQDEGGHLSPSPILPHQGGGESEVPPPVASENYQIELECIEMELGEPDASGRRRPIPKKGSEFKIKASAVISAIGQGVSSECVGAEDSEIKLTKWNTLDVNSKTFETSRNGVFAGGDCATGADIAVTAIAAGRKAATSIDQYLKGRPITGEPKSYLHLISKKPTEVPSELKSRFVETKSERTQMPELKSKERVKNFEEVETGFTAEQAAKEAERCLSCGCRSFQSCMLKKLADEYGAVSDRFVGEKRHFHIDESHEKIRYESHKCILCASCIRVCSEVKKLDALGFVNRGFVATMKPMLARPWKESTCDSCMKCVPMCPTGAISVKVTPADEVVSMRQKGTDASKTLPE